MPGSVPPQGDGGTEIPPIAAAASGRAPDPDAGDGGDGGGGGGGGGD
ncbi:MAG: hypothetical protein RML12_00275 [Xanthomonadales bacterium]|nr:hypothetical protein [Xanthomonadales bacterium]